MEISQTQIAELNDKIDRRLTDADIELLESSDGDAGFIVNSIKVFCEQNRREIEWLWGVYKILNRVGDVEILKAVESSPQPTGSEAIVRSLRECKTAMQALETRKLVSYGFRWFGSIAGIEKSSTAAVSVDIKPPDEAEISVVDAMTAIDSFIHNVTIADAPRIFESFDHESEHDSGSKHLSKTPQKVTSRERTTKAGRPSMDPFWDDVYATYLDSGYETPTAFANSKDAPRQKNGRRYKTNTVVGKISKRIKTEERDLIGREEKESCPE